MPTPKFTTTDKVIIVLFFVLYMLGYHFLISSGGGRPKQKVRTAARTERRKDSVATKAKGLRGLLPDSSFDEASYYQDHYDEYQDDPEDEIRFVPEIFDSNDE